jgi:hypothetical protein
MTIKAYADAAPLDADARLHIGLVQLYLHSPAAASAQADSIEQISPTHLFASVLRARAAAAQGDSSAMRAAYRTFRVNDPAETGKHLPEYAKHDSILAEVRAAAQIRASSNR